MFCIAISYGLVPMAYCLPHVLGPSEALPRRRPHGPPSPAAPASRGGHGIEPKLGLCHGHIPLQIGQAIGDRQEVVAIAIALAIGT